MKFREAVVTFLATLTLSATVRADLISLITDQSEWEAAVTTPIIIDFVGLDPGSQVDDEYSDLGVLFVDGFYTADHLPSLYDDEYGLDGNANTIVIEFAEEPTAFAIDHPGSVRMEFYYGGALVALTDINICSFPCFAGVLPDFVFDSVHVIKDSGDVDLDNIYFTFDPIPAPGALALLGIAALSGRSRRR